MSGLRVEKRAPAYQDLRRHALYLTAEADGAVANRFLDAVEAAFATLSKMPHIGRVRRFPHSDLGELRSWSIQGFERYVIFYRASAEKIEVVRVLHGMRDLDRIFGSEGGEIE